MTWCRLCGDRPATIGKGPDKGPILCGTCANSADAASNADRAYFEAHPKEYVYHREAFPGEVFGTERVPESTTAMVEVRKIEPGVRTRSPYWVVASE